MGDEIIVVVCFGPLLSDVHSIFLYDALDLVLGSGQPDDSRIEGLEIIARELARVAVRIHRYEQGLQFGCARTKLFQSHADVVERRRTRIRAKRVTEED